MGKLRKKVRRREVIDQVTDKAANLVAEKEIQVFGKENARWPTFFTVLGKWCRSSADLR